MTTEQLKRAEEIAAMFENVLISSWSWLWPNGHCAVSSLMLAPVLRASLEVDLHMVVGVATRRCHVHAWIESPGGDIFDPTYSQFDPKIQGSVKSNGRALVVIPAARVTDHQGEIKLTLDQEEHYRRSIKPYSHEGGWGAGSGIRRLFNEHPIPVEV